MPTQTWARREPIKAAEEEKSRVSESKGDDEVTLRQVMGALQEMKEVNTGLVKQMEMLNVKMGELQEEVKELKAEKGREIQNQEQCVGLAKARKEILENQKEEATENSDDGGPQTPPKSHAKDDDDDDYDDSGDEKGQLVLRDQRKELGRDAEQDARRSKQEEEGGKSCA